MATARKHHNRSASREAADYRRLPAEVVSVIDEGVEKGMLAADDPYVTDTRSEAAGRVAADRADMDTLLADARRSMGDTSARRLLQSMSLDIANEFQL